MFKTPFPILILTFLLSLSVSVSSTTLKEEEKMIYDEYSKARSEFNAFNKNQKAYLLAKASEYAEESYSSASSKSKYSFFRNSEGSIGFSEDSDGKTLIDFSILTVVPIKQSDDLKHTFFTQLNAMSVEQFQDRRIGTNVGLGYRNYNSNQNLVLGLNSFYDYEFDSEHYRVGFGGEIKKDLLDININYYEAMSGTKEITIDNVVGNEKALDGFDIEAGHPLPYLPWAKAFVSYYKFEGNIGEDPKGARYSTELYLHPHLTAEVGYADDRQKDGIDENYWFVKVSLSIAETNEPTLLGPDGQLYSSKIFGTRDVKSTLLKKVRRQNKIRVERIGTGAMQVGGN
ncbi:hypothetical protein HN450_03100 [bacterium]|jgi:hypothetical protein|nr:hypothetical protein [bacterium]